MSWLMVVLFIPDGTFTVQQPLFVLKNVMNKYTFVMTRLWNNWSGTKAFADERICSLI